MNPCPPHQPRPHAAPDAEPDRASLRRSWGVADDTPVIALLGDPPDRADAWTAALAVGLARVASGRPLRLLVHPRQHRRARTQDHLDRGPDADLMIQDARLAHLPAVLAGCDAGLYVGPAAPRGHAASARHAIAAGLPVAAPDTAGHRTAFAGAPQPVGFAPQGLPKKLADRLVHDALGLPGLARRFVPPAVDGMTEVS